MKILNTKEEWEEIKKKYIELYHLRKSPDWTLEKQLKINKEINDLTRFG